MKDFENEPNYFSDDEEYLVTLGIIKLDGDRVKHGPNGYNRRRS